MENFRDGVDGLEGAQKSRRREIEEPQKTAEVRRKGAGRRIEDRFLVVMKNGRVYGVFMEDGDQLGWKK